MTEPKPQIPPWQITFHEHTFTDDDLTGDDLLKIQYYVDDDWESTNVFKSPRHLLAVITVMHARLAGEPVDAVRAEIGAMKFTELPIPIRRKLDHTPPDG